MHCRDTLSRPLTGAWIDRFVAPNLAFMRRPLTGAWIETSNVPTHDTQPRRRRPLTGAWIETPRSRWLRASGGRRPLTGAWIETRMDVGDREFDQESPPHGGVD